ncbi:GNAT family N-acetyltransferase [Candidatus Uabimicrobium amorphum]|nr:GNAT family N-acetyltransferase [Candidatus Uabimicrobium amorphum]
MITHLHRYVLIGKRFFYGSLGEKELISKVMCSHDVEDLLCFFGEENTVDTRKRYSHSLEDIDGFCLGVYLHDQLAAVVWLGEQWQHFGIGGHWLGGIKVLPRLRCRGIGRYATKEAILEGRQRNISEFYVNVRYDNTPSLKLLEALRFQKVHDAQWQQKLDTYYKVRQVILVFRREA